MSAWRRIACWDVDCCRCGLQYRTVGQPPTHCPKCHEELRAACCCRPTEAPSSRRSTANRDEVTRHRAAMGLEAAL